VEEIVEEKPLDVYKLVDHYASQYGVSAEIMHSVIECESNYQTGVQSYHVKNGVREESYGIVQIHLPSHPHITKEQALDPEFSIEFMAKHMAEGGAWMWSCYNMLYS